VDLLRISEELKTDLAGGLSADERRRRLQEVGPNKLDTKNKHSPFMLLLSQFGDTMVLMLLAATLVSAVIGEYADAVTIIIIVIVNAVLGFAQEYKAERSLEALQKLSAPRAKILRAGEVISVPAENLVPGDVVFLKAGDRVPADLRIFHGSSLEIEESPLTGETLPVPKYDDGDNLAFMTCLVTRGRSQGIVLATGMDTKVGKIADLILEAEHPPTPLQQRLSKLGNALVVICIAVCLVVVAAGVFRGEQLYKMFMAGGSMAAMTAAVEHPALTPSQAAKSTNSGGRGLSCTLMISFNSLTSG